MQIYKTNQIREILKNEIHFFTNQIGKNEKWDNNSYIKKCPLS